VQRANNHSAQRNICTVFKRRERIVHIGGSVKIERCPGQFREFTIP
jgi:hypothetical protein